MQRTNSWWGAFVTLASLLVLLALGACSESTVATDAGQRDGGSFDRAVPRVDAAGHDARQADAGGEVASGPSLPDGAVAPVDLCPPDAPQLGQLCGTSGLECEYGSDPDLRCDAVFACAANLWVIGCPAAYDCNAGLSTQGCPFPDSGVQLCSMTNGSVCPASLDGVPEGAGCGGALAVCVYPAARCACDCVRDVSGACVLMDGGLRPNVWQCDTVSTPGCPAKRPRLGSPCSVIEDCVYQGNPPGSDGNEVACYFGYWMESGYACQMD